MPITQQEGRVATPFGPLDIYSDAETEWLKAMEALQRRIRSSRTRKLGIPSCSEVLAEALRLGYRKLSPEECRLFDAGLVAKMLAQRAKHTASKSSKS